MLSFYCFKLRFLFALGWYFLFYVTKVFVLLRKVNHVVNLIFLRFGYFCLCICCIFETVCGKSEACKFGVHAIICLNLHVKVGRKSVVIKTRLRPGGATHSNVGRTSDVRLD